MKTTLRHKLRVSMGILAASMSAFHCMSSATAQTLGDAVDNTSLSWSTQGDSSWFGQTSTTYSGNDAAQAPSLSHNQSASFSATVSGPGTLGFYWRVSSEGSYDYLRFSIDDAEQDAISGESGWAYRSYSIPSGSHTVRWTYSTDGSVLSGSNTGWVDAVQWNGSGGGDGGGAAGASAGSDDHGNSTGAATLITAGNSVPGNIESPADEDFFCIVVSGSGLLEVYSTGSTDTYGYLLDAAGSTLSYNDDSPFPNFRVSAQVSSGTYYLRVRHYSGSGTGSYNLYTQIGGGGPPPLTLGEALDNSSLSWSTSGNASWFPQPAGWPFSTDVAQAGNLSHNEASHLNTTVTGPGVISFDWSVSSENNYDWLGFSIGVVEQERISGEGSWATRTFAVGSGSQDLKWSYTLDGSVLSGSNAGWVDNVQWSPGAAPAPAPQPSATPDLIWRHLTSGQNAIWFMNDSALASSAYTVPESTADLDWEIGGAADFNTDGKPDLLWRHRTLDLNAVWYMDGQAMTGVAMLNPQWTGDVNWRIAGVADFDRDSKPDILWQHRVNGDVAIWHMNGVAMTTPTYTNPSNPGDLNWQICGTGDFNLDGWPDILWQHTIFRWVAIWYMNDATFVTSTLTTPTQPGLSTWDLVEAGDFNRDGRPDLFWRDSSTGTLAIWYMNNAAMTGSATVNPPSADHIDWRVQAIADFTEVIPDSDGDGLIDGWEQQYFGNLS